MVLCDNCEMKLGETKGLYDVVMQRRVKDLESGGGEGKESFRLGECLMVAKKMTFSCCIFELRRGKLTPPSRRGCLHDNAKPRFQDVLQGKDFRVAIPYVCPEHILLLR